MAQKTADRSRATKTFLVTLAVLALAALALRVAVCGELSSLRSVSEPATVTDMATYRRIATEICDGQWPEHFYYQPFYYSVYLPVIYTLFGRGPWGLMLVQSILGAFTVWLTGLTAARLFGRKAGVAAAVFLLLARFHTFYTPFLLIAVLQSFWMALLIYLVVCVRRSERWWYWCLLGLTTAFAILTRGNVLLLVPGVLGLLCWRQRRNWRRVAIYTVLFVVAMYVPQLPFSLRNLSYHGRWTGPSSAQDAVLALGNTPEAPPGGLEYPPSYHEAMRKANLPDGHAVPVTRQMLHWAWRQPMAFCELKWRTLLLFWSHTEIPNNVNMAGEGRRSVLLRFPAVVPFWLFGSLAIAGMLLLWRRRSPDRLFVYYVTIVYCLSTVLFYMLARFRIPLVPLLCVLAGGGAIQLWGRIRKARSGGEAARKRLLFSVLALAAGLYVTLKAFETYQTLFEASAMRLCRPSGVVLETPEHIAVFDHGAASMGGLTPLPVPNRGVTVQKTLIIPNSVSSAKRVTSATLRIPILMEKGSSIQVDLVGLERTASPDSDAFEDGPGYVWLNIPVAPPKSGGELTFSFTIRPTRGRISLVIDRFRDYGRTQFSGSHGEMVSIGAESAVEFRWNTE